MKPLPPLPPGCTWADPEEALAVAEREAERCAETLRRLAALDAGDPVEEGDLQPVATSTAAVGKP